MTLAPGEVRLHFNEDIKGLLLSSLPPGTVPTTVPGVFFGDVAIQRGYHGRQ
jgi:hypothetical protein